MAKKKGGRGFAGMSLEKQREIASKGGKARGKQMHEEASRRNSE